MAWEIVPVFALIAMAWWFLPRYWQGNITTVPEFLEQRFDRTTRLLMGAVMLITLVFNLLPFVLYSGGVAMSSVFHVPELLGISEPSSFLLMARNHRIVRRNLRRVRRHEGGGVVGYAVWRGLVGRRIYHSDPRADETGRRRFWRGPRARPGASGAEAESGRRAREATCRSARSSPA